MKASLLAICLLGSSIAQGECPYDNIRFAAPEPNNITILLAASCPGNPTLSEGDSLTIKLGGRSITAKATKVLTVPTVGQQITATVDNPIVDEKDGLHAFEVENSVSLIVHDTTTALTVLQEKYGRNLSKLAWSLGPTTTGQPSGTAPTPPPSTPTVGNGGAIRFKFDGEYARSGVFGAIPNSYFQTDLLVSIDTTDQPGSTFADNNRAILGINYTNLSFGDIIKHGAFGISGRYGKAFHSDVQNGDAVVTFSGWVPMLPSRTLFGSEAGFIAPPLTLSLSYGLRSAHILDHSYHGQVFEGSALYHLFLFDKFELDLGGTWTVNDLSDRPPTVPRTQRLYRVTVSYLENPSSGFRVMTGIEDGSAGTVYTKVRQYFIGVGLSKLHLGN